MKKIMLLLVLMFFGTAFGQNMKLESGDLGFLKGESEIKVAFDFKNTTFFKENMTEEAYINKRINEISSDKGAEEATRWKNDWEHTKKVTIPHKFLASLNKYGDLKGSEDANSKYMITVETTWIYPGWFAGVMNQPSKVSTLIKFAETANPSNILAVVSSEKAPGDNFVGLPNNNDRIAEGYAKTSKTLAGFIKKNMK